MRKVLSFALALGVALGVPAAAQNTPVHTVSYEPAVVRLAGALTSGEGETPDEQKVTFPAFKLNTAIRVVGDTNDKDSLNGESEDNVSLIQLVLSEGLMRQFVRLKGRDAVLVGTLFHQHTGHHYTKVLMTVQTIEPR